MSHVDHPDHYGGDRPYEVIKVLEAWGLGFHLGNAVKYIARAGKKVGSPELTDLEKARWYLDRAIALLKQPKIMPVLRCQLNDCIFEKGHSGKCSDDVIVQGH